MRNLHMQRVQFRHDWKIQDKMRHNEIGIPNSDFGEEVKAVIQLLPSIAPSNQIAEELLEFCKDELSSIKIPKTISFQEQLPRTPTGKLLKKELIAKYSK